MQCSATFLNLHFDSNCDHLCKDWHSAWLVCPEYPTDVHDELIVVFLKTFFFFFCFVARCIILLKEATAIRGYYFYERVLSSVDRWTGLQLCGPVCTVCSDTFLWEPALTFEAIWATVAHLQDHMDQCWPCHQFTVFPSSWTPARAAWAYALT